MYIKEINIKNQVCEYFDNLIKPKKLETKIYKKNYKNLVIYFSRYDNGKSVRVLSLHHTKSMETIKEHEGKKIVDSLLLYTK